MPNATLGMRLRNLERHRVPTRGAPAEWVDFGAHGDIQGVAARWNIRPDNKRE